MQEESLNPFTRHLLEPIQDPDLRRFVLRWDSLESLIVDVFRAGAADRAARRRHRALRQELIAEYPQWRPALEPHWQATRIGDAPTPRDPFEALLSLEDAKAFVENWEAMRTLPAAREALNEYLVSLASAE